MGHWQRSIRVTNLFINNKNPRFKIVESQKRALEIMIENQNKKLYNLAVDIIESGLNPSDLPIVTPLKKSENRYKVLEGNRRITALKLLLEPKLASSKSDSLRRKFKKLNKKYNISDLEEINCVVFENEEEALHWIEIKHSGELDGIGTVTWDTNSKRRFNQRLGKSTKCLQVLEFIKGTDVLEEETEDELSSIAITNLERLIDDPDVREFLGIEFIDDKLHIIYPKKEVLKGLSKIIRELVYKDIIVDDIYYKSDRANYLESFEQSEIPDIDVIYKEPKDVFSMDDSSNDLEEDNMSYGNDSNFETENKEIKKKKDKFNSKENDSNNTKNKKPRTRKRSFFRKALIPRNCKLEIEEKRINKIYMELKNIEVENFPNVTAVSLRVFLELSLDHYIQKNNLKKIGIDSKLSAKVQKVGNDLKSRNLLTDQQLKPINVSVSNPNSMISINTFNAYVHNKNLHPIGKDLKMNWDDLQDFFEAMWNN